MLAPEPATDLNSNRRQSRDELLRNIGAGAVRCGVIGLGFIGSILMNALIEARLSANGYDRMPVAVDRFRRNRAALPHAGPESYTCGDDPIILRDCNIIFVAVRNLVTGTVIDDEPLQSAARLIKRHSLRPCLVILESTVSPGTTRRFAAALGACEDNGLFVAHAPERLSAGQDHRALRATPHLVAGIDSDATELAAAMLSKVCNTVIPVSTPEVSELSKLLENAFLSVNIALTSEVTRLCLSLGVRAQEVCRAASTKPYGFMPFYPGPGVGGHCLPNDLYMFAEAARCRGWEPELLAGTIAVNNRAPRLVVERLERSLSETGIHLKDAEVLIAGVGFKPGSPDTTLSPAIEVVRVLRERGASVAYVDSLNPGFIVDGVPVSETAASNVAERKFTAGILLSGEQTLSDAALLKCCGLVLDAGGSRTHQPVASAIETL